MSFFSTNSLDGSLRETVFCEKKCTDHHSWSDEYDTQHPCPNCKTTDGNQRWVEYRPVKGRRVKLITEPGDYNHKKIRKVVDGNPYYEVEDRHGNVGFYRISEMELV